MVNRLELSRGGLLKAEVKRLRFFGAGPKPYLYYELIHQLYDRQIHEYLRLKRDAVVATPSFLYKPKLQALPWVALILRSSRSVYVLLYISGAIILMFAFRSLECTSCSQ